MTRLTCDVPTPVTAITYAGGRAAGVTVGNGEVLRSPIVVNAIPDRMVTDQSRSVQGRVHFMHASRRVYRVSVCDAAETPSFCPPAP